MCCHICVETLQVAVSQPVWILGTELRSSGSTDSSVNCWAIFQPLGPVSCSYLEHSAPRFLLTISSCLLSVFKCYLF